MEALDKQMARGEIVHEPTIGEELKVDEKVVIEELKGDEKVVNEAELKGITSDDMGEEVGQKDIESLTARVDDMSAMDMLNKTIEDEKSTEDEKREARNERAIRNQAATGVVSEKYLEYYLANEKANKDKKKKEERTEKGDG